jgi:hypothetical protein
MKSPRSVPFLFDRASPAEDLLVGSVQGPEVFNILTNQGNLTGLTFASAA